MAMFISRVPSIYSLRQLEEDSGGADLVKKGIVHSPDKPVAESAGQVLPRVSFNVHFEARKRVRSFGDLQVVPDIDALPESWSNSASDDDSPSDGRVPSPPEHALGGCSLLDTVLLAEWEERAEQGLFRYDVTACPTKPVSGVYGFIAQLNEGRQSKKRPTEFRVDQVVQEFDEAKFNFKKALQKEVLFQFEEGPAVKSLNYEPGAKTGASPNLVFINVSPIEYGHVLLVPRVLDNLPQVVDERSLLLALQFTREADNPYFRLCYNSLGAYATVNHLHFQAYYLAAPFAVERAPTISVGKRRRGVQVAKLAHYPVRGLVFEASEGLEAMAQLVGAACRCLQAANIPHNLLAVDCGQRLFLFPNAFSIAKARGTVPADLLDTQIDPAAFEIAGHLIVKREADYEAITQAWIWRLLSHASLDEEAFDKFVDMVLGA